MSTSGLHMDFTRVHHEYMHTHTHAHKVTVHDGFGPLAEANVGGDLLTSHMAAGEAKEGTPRSPSGTCLHSSSFLSLGSTP